MNPYDKDAFVRKAATLSYYEILEFANQEHSEAARQSAGVKGTVKAREAGSITYVTFLEGCLWWLRHGSCPSGMGKGDFQRLRPIAEALVKSGTLKTEALTVF